MAVWSQFEMNYMSSNTGIADILGKYKAADAGGKMTEDDYISYAETFATPTKDQLSSFDSVQQSNVKLAAADAFAKAYNLNNKMVFMHLTPECSITLCLACWTTGITI